MLAHLSPPRCATTLIQSQISTGVDTIDVVRASLTGLQTLLHQCPISFVVLKSQTIVDFIWNISPCIPFKCAHRSDSVTRDSFMFIVSSLLFALSTFVFDSIPVESQSFSYSVGRPKGESTKRKMFITRWSYALPFQLIEPITLLCVRRAFRAILTLFVFMCIRHHKYGCVAVIF